MSYVPSSSLPVGLGSFANFGYKGGGGGVKIFIVYKIPKKVLA
jgi:hypothetical protein